MKNLLLTLLLSMFLISFASSALEVSREVPSLKEDARLQISESADKYPAISIVDNWDLPLISSTKAELILTEHTESCGSSDCFSVFQITTYEDSALVDAVKFLRLTEDNDWVESNIRGYQFYIKTGSQPYEVNDYETQCNDLYKSENGTMTQDCEQVIVGTHTEYNSIYTPYTLGEIKPAGTYVVKLEGQKRPDWTYDWQIETQGKLLSEWAQWGATGLFKTGIVAYWKMDDAATPAIDSLGLINMKSGGSPNYLQTGKINKSIEFDSTGDILGYDNSSKIASWSSTQDGSINLWVYPTTTTGYDVIFDSDTGAGNSHVACFQSDGSSIINCRWQVAGGGNNDIVTSTGALPLNTWSMITTMRNNSGGSIYLYVNGVLNSSSAASATAMSWNNFTIGSDHRNNDDFVGRIDEFGVWNRSLSPSEITSLYNGGSGLTYGAGTITLNSPSNSAISATTTVTTNASATVVGATLVNTTRFIWFSNGTLAATNTTTGLSGTTSTNVFTSALSSSTYIWNQRYCDSDGACGFALSNYTFTTDLTAPTITLNYPTSLINYGAINGTLDLNFTTTDTNLQSCWYNYNGTNMSATCTSGVISANSIILNTNKSVIVYANDTAGNLNATTFSWDYKVFENSRTITTPTVETTLETFTINVTASVSLTSVYLNWNGTEYSATSSGGGVYTKTLTIPAVSTTETTPVYWRFDYSGTNISSSTTNQVINKLTFQLCNATVNNTLISFTTKSATNPFPLANTSFKSSWSIAASEGATPTTITYEDLIEDNSTYSFCTNTNTTFFVDAEIEYDASAFALNFYYLADANITTSSPQNITLYLLNNSLATTTVLKVVDRAQQPLTGYSIQIQFYDVGTGTFYLVGMAKTDYKGEDVAYLNWYDSMYKFLVYDTANQLVKNTDTTKITATPTTIGITSNTTFTYDKFEGFNYLLYFDNSTNNFVLTYSKPSGEVDQACLRVYKQDSTNSTLICNQCETSASATVFCNIGTYGNGTYTAAFYATGSLKLIDWLTQYIGGTFQETIYNLLGNEDVSFYAFLFATLITVALFVNAVFGIIALLIGLVVASVIGFTAIQWTEMMGIIIIGGFIVWLMKR